MGSLKIYVADDHTLFRESFVKLISTFNKVREVKGAANGRELLELVNIDTPDVAIVDLDMPIMDGTQVCEKLSEEFPEVKIIIVSMHDSQESIYHLLQTGAHAFLSKNAEPEELELAISSLVEKGIYRNKAMKDALKYKAKSDGGFIGRKFRKNIELTGREYSIVHLVRKGLSNKQISQELGLSENTIRNNKARLMRKLGVKNTASLVTFTFENRVLKKAV